MGRWSALSVVLLLCSCSPLPEPPAKTYGVIIDGDDEPETQWDHADNVDEGARFIQDYYRASAQDVTILSVHRGQKPTRQNIFDTAMALQQVLRPQDLLVLYTTGHGDFYDDEASVALPGGEDVSGPELAWAFADNKAGELVYIGDQCHSGGVLEAVVAAAERVGKAYTAISATSAASQTFCQTFIYPFFDAAFEKKNDADHDGSVSEEEAFTVAKRAHLRSFSDRPEMADAIFRQSP